MISRHATLSDGRKIRYLPEVIGEGGFKEVYFTQDRRSVVCFFKDPNAGGDPNRRARLEAILGRNNPTTDPATGAYFAKLFCWPTGIVESPRFGLLAPAYPPEFFFAEGRWKGQEKNGRWFASPKLRKLLPASERGHWRNYLELCLEVARGVRRMHAAGLAHSDLSCNNVLIDPPRGRAVIIDVDSLVVKDLFPPDVAGTPGYIAPEVMATLHLPLNHPDRCLPSTATDTHALAVLIYEYLLRRHPLRGPKVHDPDPERDDLLAFGERALFVEDPKDSSNRPADLGVPLEALGPYLAAAFLQTFVVGLRKPNQRTTAQVWEAALAKTLDLLVPCANPGCEERWFAYREGVPSRCPWCGVPAGGPFPVLEFLYAPRAGQYRLENHRLVGHHDRPLFPWHVHRNVGCNESVQAVPQARVVHRHGRWLLLNEALPSMIGTAGSPVPVGQACPLTDGADLLLSRDETGRMLAVRLVG